MNIVKIRAGGGRRLRRNGFLPQTIGLQVRGAAAAMPGRQMRGGRRQEEESTTQAQQTTAEE